MAQDERVPLRDVTYHISVRGPRDAPLVVFLHGFFGAGADLSHVARACCQSFCCVTVDLPGHGRSDAPADPRRYALPETAADLASLLDYFQRRTASLVGYSMGGRSALAFAAHFPERVRSLVLESASPGLASRVSRRERRLQDEALAARFLATDLDRMAEVWEGQPLFFSQRALSAEQRAAQRASRLRQRPFGLANSLLGAGTGAQPSYWGSLARLHCPVLLVTGGQDEKFTRIAERMAGLLPHCKRAQCVRAGHNVHLEEPDWYAKQVCDFLLHQHRRGEWMG